MLNDYQALGGCMASVGKVSVRYLYVSKYSNNSNIEVGANYI